MILDGLNGRQIGDKWTKTVTLLDDLTVAHLIPETRMYNKDHFKAMLKKYGKIVLKPVKGTDGRGLILVVKDAKKYFCHHEKELRHFTSFHALLSFIEQVRNKKEYLVQRGIHLATINGRPIDYRITVEKKDGKWTVTNFIGRLSHHKLFITNLSRGGKKLIFKEAIKRSLPSLDVKKVEKKIIKLTQISAELLEKRFKGFRSLGFDYGIDQRGRLWLFEVNTHPL